MSRTTLLLRACAALATAAAAVAAARLLAARQLRRRVRALFAGSTDVAGQTYHEAQLVGLPAPVQRYFRGVLPEGQHYLRGVRLRHTGQFKAALQQGWTSIEGEEYLVADPPSFIWQGATRWFTARDSYVRGHGHLGVRLLGAVPILCGAGPSYDQGELLRWLGESTWLPTALLPSRQVQWSAVDEDSARLSLTHGGQTVHYLVRFNARHEIAQCETERYQGETRLLPWIGRFSHYRKVLGVRVPMQLEALWVQDGRQCPYARFTVQELEYAPLAPY